MKCYNRNTTEYKLLLGEFQNTMKVDGIIDKWQTKNSSEAIPSVVDAAGIMTDINKEFKRKQKDFGKSILNKLTELNLARKVNNNYYIKSTGALSNEYNERVLNNNLERIQRYLQFKNIPIESVILKATESSYQIQIDTNVIHTDDIIERSRDNDGTHTVDVIEHLTRMFPNLDVNIVGIEEARRHYEGLPTSQKAKVSFDNIKSYIVDGNVKLIEGRTTVETSIEEMLHPFVDALYVDNKSLFNNLESEARVTFPSLSKEIEDTYTEKLGFNKTDRSLELVTQALSRHFKKEYEEKPSATWTDLITKVLDWLKRVVNDLHRYIIGRPLTVTSVSANATMSDVARLLNTIDLKFDINNKSIGNKVKYKLKPEKQRIVNRALDLSTTEMQREIIKRMFHLASTIPEEIGTLAVSRSTIAPGDKIVVLNKANHTYYEVGEELVEYRSLTNAIKGEDPDLDISKKLNVRVGNDFDAIADGIVAGLEFHEILPQMDVIPREDALEGYNQLKGILSAMTADGSVLIPQVTLFDPDTKIAGTADIVVIDPQGRIGIVDLKTSKNSITGDDYAETPYELEDNSLLKQRGITELTTKGQHGVQLNGYRRMAENMGYQMMDDGLWAVQTIHLLVNITKDNTKYEGLVGINGYTQHLPSENIDKVNLLIPRNVSENAALDILSIANQHGVNPAFNKNTPADSQVDAPENNKVSGTAYDTMLLALRNFQTGLIKRREAIEKTKDSISHAMTREQSLKQIIDIISGIEVAIHRGSDAVSRQFTKLIQMSIREIEDFVKYTKDPSNLQGDENQDKFISHVLNFNQFVQTYRGLIKLKDTSKLNSHQNILIVNLMGQLDGLVGDKNYTDEEGKGIINQAIFDYVSALGMGLSNKGLTKEEFEKMMKLTKDISMFEATTYDLDTSSDTLSALMAKIWKRKRFKTLENAQEREDLIRLNASKLLKLSPTDKVDYSFMLQFDENNEFTGFYIRKIGYDYWRMRREFKNKLYDENGDWMEYIHIQSLSTARKQDIEFNKKLYKARKEYGAFLSAEEIDDEGNLSEGEYHRYTDAFKKERKKYQKVTLVGDWPQWERKTGKDKVSDTEYQEFIARNYDVRDIHYGVKDYAGNFTGKTKALRKRVVKRQNSEIRDMSSKGQDMRDPKWVQIMNPQNALQEAQKDFYLMFREHFEEKLLKKLPMSVRSQMLGKAPLVMGNLADTVREQPNIVATLWAKAVNGTKSFFTTTQHMKRVVTNEAGEMVDTLPIFYTGNPRDDKELQQISDELANLRESWKKKIISKEDYTDQVEILKGKRQRLMTQPTRQEISQDMADSLLRFSLMAENYEVMGTAQDTYTAIIKVLEDRQYQADRSTKMVANIKGKLTEVGVKGVDHDSNTVRRVKKWMKMVYYDNDNMTQSTLEKITKALISYSSLSYVAFNVFGNINNYTIARINNAIETVGGRFYEPAAMRRAVVEFNKRGLPDVIRRTAFNFNKKAYDRYKPTSKYEVMVDYFRMMDEKGALREQGEPTGEKKSWFSRWTEWGYILQDAGEYNVQTKVGMAILMSKTIRNSKTGDTMNLYDAYNVDGDGKPFLDPGYDVLIDNRTKKEVAFSDIARADLRNEIREVNKQIHGNYAYEDRMAIQSHSLGQLAAQFHKWVIPAIKARYRPEYFDENLGWMEGRYRSFLSFIKYAFTNMGEINKWATGFKEYEGGPEGSAQNKLLNVYRTLGEIGIMMTTFAMISILSNMFEDDDDDSEYVKRLENALIYQADRTYKEMIQFIPLPGLGGLEQMYQMMKSPIASTRTLGELGQAISTTARTGVGYLYYDDKEFWGDSDFVYQRGKKGKKQKLKFSKEWSDAVPILYGIQRWEGYDKEKSFYIK